MGEKVVDGYRDGTNHANLRHISRYSSKLESCCSMKKSIQKLKKDFIAIVYEKDESELRDLSEQKTLLPFLANQDSSSDLEIKF